MGKIDWGSGKTLVFQWEEKIVQLMKSGKGYDQIYDTLKEQGMNVTRRTFVRYAPDIKANNSSLAIASNG